MKSLTIENEYYLIGEMGFRKGWWKDYDEPESILKELKLRSREEKAKKKDNSKPNFPPYQQQPEPDQKEVEKKRVEKEQKKRNQNQSPTFLPTNQTPELPKENQPTNNQNKDNSSPNQEEKSNPTSTTLSNSNFSPSTTEIQTHYDSDKDKSEIKNNSNLTNNQEKQKAEELLKIVIAVELLIQKRQFNQELLSKITKEKEQNTSLYQLLNKNGRLDKVINQFQVIEKNNNSAENKNSFSPKTILVSLSLASLTLAIIGTIVLIKRKSRKKPVL